MVFRGQTRTNLRSEGVQVLEETAIQFVRVVLKFWTITVSTGLNQKRSEAPAWKP